MQWSTQKTYQVLKIEIKLDVKQENEKLQALEKHFFFIFGYALDE